MANNEIESGYFWDVPSENPLVRLGIIKESTPELDWIETMFARQREERDTPSTLEKVWGALTWVKDIVEEPLDEVKEGIFNIWRDVVSLSKWDIKNAPWLIWDFARSTRKWADRIIKLNKAIDETGWTTADKAIWFGLNIFGEVVDFWWDVIMAGIKTIAPESLEQATEQGIKTFAQSEFWQDVIWFAKEGGVKWQQFKESSPEANRFWLSVESVLPVAEVLTWGLWGKLIKKIGWETIEAWVKWAWELVEAGKDITWKGIESLKEWVTSLKESIPDIKLPSLKREVDELPSELRTVTWKIWDTEVQVPQVIRPLTEIAADKISPTITNKTLAGSAVRPRTIWKSRKQKLDSIAKVEERVQNFYNNIRIGKLDWDISTLENAAQSMVSNLDTVGARIGSAVQKVDWNIQFDNELTDNIINALNSKGAEVSPASPILTKFFETLWDWNLSISEAYDLKKAYSNEVSKLVKWWDAWTAQYKALADWVNFLNTKIDEIIETKLWGQFADDKKLYRDLLFLADDMVASSLVDGRRTANTLAERIGMLESITSPIASTKWKLISASERVNTRGWAWEELIKRYDEEAIKNAWIK